MHTQPSLSARLAALALAALAGSAAAQTPQDFEQQVLRGVSHMTLSRARQLGSGEWLREGIAVERVATRIETRGPEAQAPVGVVTARVTVRHSRKATEAEARSDTLPLNYAARGYEVDLRFVPDAGYGKWAFDGGRYWTLDGEGQRHLELKMFADLLREAPVDAPHELAWAIMSP